MSNLGHIVVQDPNIVSMDVAMHAAVRELGIELTLTGGSGHGWSRSSTLQKCPYKYYKKYVQGQTAWEDGLPPNPLQIGGAFHAFLACYYQREIDFSKGTPEDECCPEASLLADALIDHNADVALVNEAWRLFDGYANYYEQHGDWLKPLAVEYWAKDPTGPDTCRLDLIAEVEDHQTILPGTYIVEHKSASRMGREQSEGWHLDGEILGQINIWRKARLSAKFGKLQGVIVNVVVKTAIPQFHREVVTPPLKSTRRQSKDLKVFRATLAMYESMGYWPRAVASCIGRYGFCEFWDECRGAE